MSRPFSWALAVGAAVSALLTGVGPAVAADNDDTITITARVPQKETPSSVTIITEKDLERAQVTSVYEALRTVPGISSNQSGGPGQIATIRLRGSNSGETLTLIDGVPVNDTTSTSGYNYGFLDSGVVQRIEVLRGAGSAIWGSDAIGGVVNVITYQPGQNAVKAYAEGGSFGTGRMGARAAYGLGALTLSGYGTAFSTAGISAFDEHLGGVEKDGADAVTLGGRAFWKIGAGFSAQLGLRTTQGHSDFDEDTTFASPAGNGDAADFYHSRESLADAGLAWRSESGDWGVNLSGSQNLTKTSSESELFGPFQVRAQRTQRRLTADGNIAPNQTVLVGYEHSKLRSITSFAQSAATKTDAGFATYSGKFYERLLLEAGLRYENNDTWGRVTTGRLGAAIDVWDGGLIRATLGNAYRAPTIFEVNGQPFKGPNFDLQPEKSNEWELGVEQKLFDDRLRLSAVYFDQRTKGLITATGFATFVNLPRADSKGVELSATSKLGPVDLSASYTYDKATDRTANAQQLRVPKHSGSVDATWHLSDKFALGGQVMWNGKENDMNFGTFLPVALDSWTRLDLRASYQLSNNVEVYGRVENLADEVYEEAFSYGTLGRGAYIGIRVKQ